MIEVALFWAVCAALVLGFVAGVATERRLWVREMRYDWRRQR